MAATTLNLNGATIHDGAGNTASLSLSGLTQAGPQIDTTAPNAPVINSDSISGSDVKLIGSAEANATINIYDGGALVGTVEANGSGVWALTTGPLSNGAHSFTATATDGAGNTSVASQAVDPVIGTTNTTPAATSVTKSLSSGDLGAGHTIILTIGLNETVTVAGGMPTLTLNDGGVATYTGGSGTGALTFSYTVAAGQNAASLAATTVNLNGATIHDGAGNTASLSLSGLTQAGPQIDTTAPNAPVINSDSISGSDVKLIGSAEANATINIYDGGALVGTVEANGSGDGSRRPGRCRTAPILSPQLRRMEPAILASPRKLLIQ